MNKVACLIAVMAFFAVASSQLIYGNGLIGSPYTSSAYMSSINHGAAVVPGLYAGAPLTNAWTSHYAAAPLVGAYGYYKK